MIGTTEKTRSAPDSVAAVKARVRASPVRAARARSRGSRRAPVSKPTEEVRISPAPLKVMRTGGTCPWDAALSRPRSALCASEIASTPS